MIAATPILQSYLAAYPDWQVNLPGAQSSQVAALRANGLQAFSAQGFPNQRQEEWRYTPLASLNKQAFLPVLPTAVTVDSIAAQRLADAYCVVLVNGHFDAALSALAGLPAGVTVTGLNQRLRSAPDSLNAWLGQAVNLAEHSLIAFNDAWFADGVFIEIPAGVQLQKPLQILHWVSAEQALAVTRQVIVVQADAALELVETFVGSAESYFTCAVNECFLQEQASLTFTKVQSEAAAANHFGGTYVKQAAASQFCQQNFAFGAQLARTDSHCDLGAASHCELNGLYLGHKRQHIDNHTRINHLKPNAVSREYYKGVLADRARGVFQGRVLVAVDAQHTDAQMNNRNLLLSADAEIDTKPQLEIYADDVKCAHGVTVGQLDEKSVFFLQARGLEPAAARNILTFAFANEMVDKVTNPALRTLLLAQLKLHFPAVDI